MVKVIVEGPNKKSSVGTRMNYVFSRVPARPDHRITWPGLARHKSWPGPAQNLWPGPLPGPDLKKSARSLLYLILSQKYQN